MTKTGLGLALLAAFALSGCGNDSDNNNPYMYQQGVGVGGGYAPIQGYCSPEVVNAYNNFQRQCDLSRYGNNMNFQPCRMSAEHFLRLYPNISCVAAPYGQGFGRGYQYNDYFRQYQGQQVFHITSFPMRNMLQFLEQTGRGGNNSGWQQYPRWPQVSQPRGRF